MLKKPRSSRTTADSSDRLAASNEGDDGSATAINETAAVPDPYESDFDFLLVNGSIDGQLFHSVLKAVVSKEDRAPKVVLCLVTYGGSANDAYRIGKFIQQMYDDFAVFVPSSCKSAGTLIACAANTVIMASWGLSTYNY